jgi:hypothetical protein
MVGGEGRGLVGLSGWSAAGTPIEGPGALVLPVRDPAGVPHLALQFYPDLAEHPLLRQGIDLIASFIQQPTMEGIAPLVAWEREKATFVYPSTDGVLVATLLERCGANRRPAGVRAALELLITVGPMLDEAARAGRRAGLLGHGALNPWRILLHPSGRATLLGHGIPAVEIAAWLEQTGGGGRVSREPGVGLRYFAPERIEEGDEDLRADLYALAVTATELALGHPLLTGTGPALATAIREGAALTALRGESLPAPVRELFSELLAVDSGDRPVSGKATASRASALLPQAAGPSLVELLAPEPVREPAPQAPAVPAPPPGLALSTSGSRSTPPAAAREAVPAPNSPRSVAPVSVAPVSVAPVSVAPVSAAPVSAAPVSVPPPSLPPRSVPPRSLIVPPQPANGSHSPTPSRPPPARSAPPSVAPKSVRPVTSRTSPPRDVLPSLEELGPDLSSAPWARSSGGDDDEEGLEPTLVDGMDEPTVVDDALTRRPPTQPPVSAAPVTPAPVTPVPAPATSVPLTSVPLTPVPGTVTPVPAAPRQATSKPPARPSPSPDPPTVPYGADEEVTTNVGKLPSDLLQLVAPVEDLPRDASLAVIQRHALRIVARTEKLALHAETMFLALVERSAEQAQVPAGLTGPAGLAGPQVLKAARGGADRAMRASDSAKSAASLIELDEDASGALITLDLVRNAELQCESAVQEVRAQLLELDRAAERVQMQVRALADAARRARDHANRSTDAANQADDIVTELEQELRAGKLGAPGVDEVVDAAISAADRADAAAEEARAQAELASTAERSEVGQRHAEIARRAEDVAMQSLLEVKQSAERARKLEADGKTTATDLAVERVVAARLATEEANRALKRADESMSAASTSESRQLRTRCAVRARDAATAQAEAEEALTRVRAASTTREAFQELEATASSLKRAQEASAEAVADSDRVVALAGELARARAQLSKLQEEAAALVERAQASVARLREEADRLREETARLSGAIGAEVEAETATLVRDVEQLLGSMDRPLVAATQAMEAAAAEGAVSELRQLAQRLGALVEESRARLGSVRSAAEAELAELRRRDERSRAVEQAAQEARGHAQRCRELVDQAWKVAKGLSSALRTTDLEEAIRYRTKALEIIDIAEFQAGEASSSAELAAGETDPAEARAHAQTALSFLERITADLPEAVEALELAETITRTETELLQTSRSRTAEVASLIEALGAEVQAQLQAVRTEAARWRGDEAVAAQLAVLEQFGVAFQEDLNESGWARDRASAARSGSEAAELVPNAEAALVRAKEKKRRVDALMDTVRRAIAAADAAAVAVQEARRSTRAAAEAVASDLSRLLAAQQRLADAIAQHAAREEASSNAELHMREAVGEVRRLHEELRALAASSDVVQTPEEARRLSARATELVRAVERASELAAEAEARGVAAAEHEARSRAEARRRRVQALREEAEEQVRRASSLLERLGTSLAEVDAQVTSTGNELARMRLEEARRLADLARAHLTDVEQSGRVAATAADDDVERHTERARQGADRIAAEASRVMGVAQEALDLARAAAAEAEALRSVRNEVASTAEKADEAVERARAESARLPSVAREAPGLDLPSLMEEATQHVQAASKAAAKVRAAIPLASQADALGVAQSILRTARMALDRANASADGVRAITDRVLEQVRQEKEHAAKALSDARAAAAKPAHEAVAAARKAEGWLEAGRREAGTVSEDNATYSALRGLERSVSEVRRLADEALAKAERAESAASISAALAAAPEIASAASLTLDAAERARAALAGLRDRIGAVRAELDAVQSVAAEAAEQAAAASQVAEQGEASLRELEHAVEIEFVGSAGSSQSLTAALSVAGAMPIVRALEAVRTASTNARFAAASAGQAAERARQSRARSEVEAAAEAAHSALEDALDALEKVVEAEQACRAALESRKEMMTAEARRSESERKRAAEQQAREIESRQREEARQLAEREQQQSVERQRREEERKANVERRREERRTGGVPSLRPANDRESLRSMLRQSRPALSASTEGAEGTSARPRRRGDLLEPNQTQPNPDLRSWSPRLSVPPQAEEAPGAESTGRMTAPKRASRPSAARPASVPPAPPLPVSPAPPRDEELTEPRDTSRPPTNLTRSSDSPNVDALLLRLRARRAERD